MAATLNGWVNAQVQNTAQDMPTSENDSFGIVATPQQALTFTNTFIRVPTYTGRNFDTYTVSGVEGQTMDEDSKLMATILAAKYLQVEGFQEAIEDIRQAVNEAFKDGKRPVNFWTRVPNGHGVNTQGQVYKRGTQRGQPTTDQS